jgi:2'-5' RNA ligase
MTDTAARESARKVSALFCIDNSGSMSSDFASVLDAVQYIRDASERIMPAWILFNSVASRNTVEQVLASKVTGSTSFANVIMALCDFIDSVPRDEPVVCVFMTDGENTLKPGPDEALARLRRVVASRGASVQLHCIGFGRSCDKRFCEHLVEAGSAGSMFRVAAERADLNQQLGELFDFFDRTMPVELQLPDGSTQTVDCVIDGDCAVLDLMTSAAALGLGDGDGDGDRDETVVLRLNGVAVPAARRPVDFFFDLALVESLAQTTEQDVVLDALKRLAGLNPAAAPRAMREEAWRRKQHVQQRLDATLAVLAQAAKLGVSGVAARLDAVRYDAKLLKTRRRRLADKRALGNAARFSAAAAEKAPALSDDELAALRRACFDERCSLTGETIDEVVQASEHDFVVFSLDVTRAEHALEAPSTIQVHGVAAGVYSFEAFVQAQTFALENDADAHESGYFLSANGSKMNCCLPLFITEAHWRKRVSHGPALAMCLGHAFALDALAWREDSYIALHSVLGQLLALRARGALAASDWLDFVVNDLAKTCAAVRPRLRRWCFASQFAGGVIRGDLLAEFLATPRGRQSDVLASLYTVVGMAHTDRDQSLSALMERLADVADGGGAGDKLIGNAAAAAVAADVAAAAPSPSALPALLPVAGLSNQRSPLAALALVVPEALAAPIEAIRQLHDPAFSRWPPHANFLFPFLPANEVGDAGVLAQLDAALLARVPQFRVTLARFDVFASSGTLYLRVDVEPREALDVIYGAVAALFPQCCGKAREFHAHVTVARGEVPALEALAVQLRATWKPIEFVCERLGVLTREAETRFVEAHGVALAPLGSIDLRPAGGPQLLRGAVAFDEHRFRVTIAEELWRRALRNLYKSNPGALDSHLETLLYGPAAAAAANEVAAPAAVNLNQNDAEFAAWAHFRWEEIGKKKCDLVRRAGVPKFLGLLAADTTEDSPHQFEPRKLTALDDAVTCDEQVQALLDLIAPACQALAGVTGGATLGDGGGISRRERFLMMVNALQFARPHSSGHAENGRWKNTLDASPAELFEPLHAMFEGERRDKWTSVIHEKNAETTALSMARCTTRDAFCGRALVACATRGGKAFDSLVSLLCDGTEWPLRLFKLQCLLTGKCDSNSERLMFGGLSWTSCSANTALRIRELVGKDDFMRIEMQMHGSVGWVYRDSDIPNRLGHCNSTPWPGHSSNAFRGFELDKIVKGLGVQF